MGPEDYKKCFEFGKLFGERVCEYQKKFDGGLSGECRRPGGATLGL
jgi:hypothetical protein